MPLAYNRRKVCRDKFHQSQEHLGVVPGDIATTLARKAKVDIASTLHNQHIGFLF